MKPVLVVDADEGSRKRIRAALAARGLPSTEATSAREALEIAGGDVPSLLILFVEPSESIPRGGCGS